MVTIEKGTAADREEIIDFANYVFSYSHEPHDFKLAVPILYGEESGSEPYHYLLREDGKLRAMLCAYPRQLQMRGWRILTNFIGTVSVHPYARGKNYMKRLMNEALRQEKEKGIVLSALGGQRQRYRYFGYEKGGCQMNASINESNVRHAWSSVEAGFEFRPIEHGSPELAQAYRMYESRDCGIVRPEDVFFRTLHEWKAVPYAVLDGGRMVGYLSVSGNRQVQELLLERESDFPCTVKSYWQQFHPQSLEWTAAPWEKERQESLLADAEWCSINWNQNFRILDYPAFIFWILSAAAKERKLENGTLVLQLEGERYQVTVADQKISCLPGGKKPDAELDAAGAVAFFTWQYDRKREETARKKTCIRSWFPCELCISEIDGC